MFGSTDYRGDKAKMTTRISAAQESLLAARTAWNEANKRAQVLERLEQRLGHGGPAGRPHPQRGQVGPAIHGIHHRTVSGRGGASAC